MKRSFNYTDRIKIHQSAVSVRLYYEPEGIQSFDAVIDLSGQKQIPRGAEIYLEAYYRTSLKRFIVGTFEPSNPHYVLRAERLDDLQDPIVNFRVKIVDTSHHIGRILAVIERVQTYNEQSRRIERLGLLKVNFGADLGHKVWDVEISNDGDDPMLCINRSLNVDDIALREFVARNPAFVSLVFPEVLRRILNRLIDDDVDFEDEDSWSTKWVRFANSLGVKSLPTSSDKDEAEWWVEEVVDAFCKQTSIKQRFEDLLGNDSL